MQKAALLAKGGFLRVNDCLLEPARAAMPQADALA